MGLSDGRSPMSDPTTTPGAGIYDTLARTMRDVLPRGGAPTAVPSAEAACRDIEALGTRVRVLEEALRMGLELIDDQAAYVPDYFAKKWGHDDTRAQVHKALSGGGGQHDE